MEAWKLWGTIVNMLTVVGGSLIGLLFRRLLGGKKNDRMEAVSDAIFKGLALCVLAIGVSGTIGGFGDCTLVVIVSMALGALIGQLLNLEKGVNFLGKKIEGLAREKFGNVAEGFVAASLLFCVGSMTVVGSLNSGLSGDHTMLYTKATLDFVSAIVFSVSLGVGVLFSALFVLVFQGSITLLAGALAPVLSGEVITAMTVTGSILIIGLALNMLGLTKLKIMNYLPAVFLPALIIPLYTWVSGLF